MVYHLERRRTAHMSKRLIRFILFGAVGFFIFVLWFTVSVCWLRSLADRVLFSPDVTDNFATTVRHAGCAEPRDLCKDDGRTT